MFWTEGVQVFKGTERKQMPVGECGGGGTSGTRGDKWEKGECPKGEEEYHHILSDTTS